MLTLQYVSNVEITLSCIMLKLNRVSREHGVIDDIGIVTLTHAGYLRTGGRS